MTRWFLPRYFLASIALLLALVALYAASAARRTQRELLAQLEEKASALAEALESSSRNAIQGNALMAAGPALGRCPRAGHPPGGGGGDGSHLLHAAPSSG